MGFLHASYSHQALLGHYKYIMADTLSRLNQPERHPAHGVATHMFPVTSKIPSINKQNLTEYARDQFYIYGFGRVLE